MSGLSDLGISAAGTGGGGGGGGSTTPVALTDGATIAVDASASTYFTVTLGGNRTLANPTNLTAGWSGRIVIRQDGTGTRTLAYGGNYKFPGGITPVLSTAVNAIDVLDLTYDGTTLMGALSKGYA